MTEREEIEKLTKDLEDMNRAFIDYEAIVSQLAGQIKEALKIGNQETAMFILNAMLDSPKI